MCDPMTGCMAGVIEWGVVGRLDGCDGRPGCHRLSACICMSVSWGPREGGGVLFMEDTKGTCAWCECLGTESFEQGRTPHPHLAEVDTCLQPQLLVREQVFMRTIFGSRNWLVEEPCTSAGWLPAGWEGKNWIEVQGLVWWREYAGTRRHRGGH
jgi:hypothetical protein